MKNIRIGCCLLAPLLGCSEAKVRSEPTDYYQLQSQKPVPISVTKFTNEAAASAGLAGNCFSWGWFTSDLGNAFQDLAIDELLHYQKIQMLERSTISDIYQNEVNLVNSEHEQTLKKGHFKKAHYTVVGVVNSFEYCASSRSAEASYSSDSDLSTAVAGAGMFLASKIFDGKSTATVEVTVRLIDTQTGAIVASSKGHGEQKRSSLAGDLHLQNFSIAASDFKQSPLSDAIRDAIHQGVNSLLANAKL